MLNNEIICKLVSEFGTGNYNVKIFNNKICFVNKDESDDGEAYVVSLLKGNHYCDYYTTVYDTFADCTRVVRKVADESCEELVTNIRQLLLDNGYKHKRVKTLSVDSNDVDNIVFACGLIFTLNAIAQIISSGLSKDTLANVPLAVIGIVLILIGLNIIESTSLFRWREVMIVIDAVALAGIYSLLRLCLMAEISIQFAAIAGVAIVLIALFGVAFHIVYKHNIITL